VSLQRRAFAERVPVAILGCSTADAAHPTTQDDIRTAALPHIGDLEYMLKVLDSSGVATRTLAMPIDWYMTEHDWGERMAVYARVGADLIQAAAQHALDLACLAPSAVDAVVFVSSTGLQVPSLDATLVDRLGLRPDVERTPIAGLGCSGGAVGLARAADLARLWPGRTVLLVGVELCSIHMSTVVTQPVEVVSLALFGDGAYAAVLRSADPADPAAGQGLARLVSSAESWCPDTAHLAGVGSRGNVLAPAMDRDLPQRVGEEIVAAIAAFLQAQALDPARLQGYILHVASLKMLETLGRRLGVGRAGVATSVDVLREHGNTSGASVIYALDRTLARREAGLYVLAAPGPGLSIHTLLLEIMPLLEVVPA